MAEIKFNTQEILDLYNQKPSSSLILNNQFDLSKEKDNDDNDSIRVRSIIDMPCTMCEEVIRCKQTDESGQMKEMIEHFENVHKQKMCPVCSVLFDTRLSIFKSYFSTHLQNHFNQMKYPSTSSSSK